MSVHRTPDMSTSHDCPGGCGRRVPYQLFACRSCWYRLPFTIRRLMTLSWKMNHLTEHSEYVAEAVEWYAEHPLRRGVSDGG